MTATLTDAQVAQLREAAQKMSDEQFPLLRELILALLDEREVTRSHVENTALHIERIEDARLAAVAERDNLEIAVGALTATALYRRAEAAEADAARLRKALEPFAEVADILDVQAEGDRFCWGGNEQKQPIHVWLGPTDFGTARAALTTKGTSE